MEWLRSWFLAQIRFVLSSACTLFKVDRGHLDCILFFRCLFPRREWKLQERQEYKRSKISSSITFLYCVLNQISVFDSESHWQFLWYVTTVHQPFFFASSFNLSSEINLHFCAHILAPNYWVSKTPVDFRSEWNCRCGLRNWVRGLRNITPFGCLRW